MIKLYERLGCLAAAMLMFVLSAVAQDRIISGTVTDETGTGMPGVNVVIKGTTFGATTNAEGRFTINVPNDDAVLVVSFVGYATQEIAVGGRSSIDVQLTPDVMALTEVVVTGYATQEKKDLTGAVGTVKPAELIQIPSSNITSQLQGRVAGVTVSGDGRPGQAAKIRIRGFASFSGSNDPLYIVDGVPTQDISTLNPNDVETISVLKDAGAASIYGSRASNGVIVITTKKGQTDRVRVNYDMYYGTQDPGDGPENLLNAKEFADLQWLVYRNDGTEETHPVYGPSTNASPTLPAWAGDTDWYDVITRSALIMNHDLSLSGGTEKSKFYAGLNYFNQEGIVISNFSKRYAARLNSEFKVANDVITIGESFTVTGRTGLGVAGNGSEGSPVARVYMIQPIIPARITTPVNGISHNFVEGEYGGTGIAPRLGNGPNPLADLERVADNRQGDIRLLGSAFLDARIFKGLNFRTNFGGTYQNGYNTGWNGSTYERSENVATPSYSETAYFNSDWVWTNTLTFDKLIGSHKILAVGGYEAVKYGIGRGVNAARAGYFSDAFSFRTVSNGAQITGATSWFNTPTTLTSTFLRADYSFKDKYYLSATVRRDGSSRFGEEFKHGVFPSVSAGWRISDELFLANAEFITDFKIRGGYGTMGNQLPVDPSNQFYLFGGSAGDSNYDLNGTTNSSLQGFRPTRIGNIDTKWETQITTNIGFDAGFLDNKVTVSFDWYQKKSEDLLVNVPLSALYGAASAPARNVGDMKNTGIDLQLGYRNKIGNDLSLDANLVFTSYKNEIIRFAPGIDFFNSGGSRIGGFNRNEVGRSISEFYGYQVAGLWQTAQEVADADAMDGDATSVFQAGAEPGFFRYADINGDGVISPDDRTFIGNPNPDFTYGLNLGLTFKNFDLSAFFYGSEGNEIFNYNRWWLDFWPSFQNQKSRELLYNSWTPERTNTNVPKASNKSNFSTNTQSVSYYVEDGSFMRLKNLQIGFTFPQAAIQSIGLNRLRIYVQGLNLFTISNYSGLDPDINNGPDVAFGVDQGAYPLVKQYVVGLNVGF